MFMCIELMLNAANLTFVTFARMLNDIGGQALVFFVLVVAAAEVVVGLGHRGHHLPAPVDDRGRRPPFVEGLTEPCSTLPSSCRCCRWPASWCWSPSAAASATRWPGWIGTVAVPARSWWPAWCWPACSSRPTPTGSSCDNYFTWFHVGGLTVPVGILVDPLSVTMCMFITGVSTLIHLYSIGYMKGDRDYSKFFIYLNLFVFSMLVLVLANNLLLTFVGLGGRRRLLLLAGRRSGSTATRPPRPARRPSSTTASATSASCSPSS